jgi:hypothetical protein
MYGGSVLQGGVLRNVSLVLRNVSLVLRNVSVVLRNVSLVWLCSLRCRPSVW